MRNELEKQRSRLILAAEDQVERFCRAKTEMDRCDRVRSEKRSQAQARFIDAKKGLATALGMMDTAGLKAMASGIRDKMFRRLIRMMSEE